MHEHRYDLRRGALVAAVVGAALVNVVVLSTAPPGASAAATLGPPLHLKVRDGRGGYGRRVVTRVATNVSAGANFGADRLFDGDHSTAWCVPASAAVGATIVFAFDRTVTVDAIDVRAVVDDNIPHRAITTLAFSDLVHKYTVDLEAGETEVELGLDPVMRGKRISMRIMAVDRNGAGTACLSELRLSYRGAKLGPFPPAGTRAGTKDKPKISAKTKTLTPT